MGKRGPVPKRSAERRRQNADSRPSRVHRTGRVPVPAAPKDLHRVARRWYASLRRSGQADLFEPSDWAAALYVAEVMSKNLNQPQFSSVLFAAVWNAMNDLLTTEQARCRARIEVQRAVEEAEAASPGVTAIDEYRKRLQA